MGDLYNDIYFGDINQRYEELADISKEEWSMPGKNDKKYIKKLFEIYI